MPSIQLTDDQVAELFDHLSPARQVGALQAMVRTAMSAKESMDEDDCFIVRQWCGDKGLQWDMMSDAERSWHFLEVFAAGALEPERGPENDIELVIDESLRTMKETQVRNRERVVSAITLKNNMQNLVLNEERLVTNLQEKLDVARAMGHSNLATQLERERELHEGCLKQLRESLHQAENTSEAVKESIRREEELLRLKTAEALAFKADYKRKQIDIQMQGSGAEFDCGEQFEGADMTSAIEPDELDERIEELQNRLGELGIRMKKLG